MDAWHMFVWLWAAILFAYFVVQVIALRRLDGERKKASRKILLAMVILELGSNSVREVLGIRDVSRVGTIIVGIAAIVAISILIRMLRNQRELLKADS